MKIKRRIIENLETLTPSELLSVHTIMLAMKRGRQVREVHDQPEQPAFMRVGMALSSWKGPMSDDIVLAREDRA